MNGQQDGCMDSKVDELIARWMYGLQDGWIDELQDGWMGSKN